MESSQVFNWTFLSIAAVVGCNDSPNNSEPFAKSNLAIVNGQDAQTHAFPFMVSLKMRAVRMKGDIVEEESFQHLCGASLISPKMILTAAHCVVAVKDHDPAEGQFSLTIPCGDDEMCGITYPAEGFAFVGEYSQGDDEPGVETRKYTASDIQIHPDFERKTGKNDLAVITLKEASRKLPVALPTREAYALTEDGGFLLLLGWGRLWDPSEALDEEVTPYPTVLQKAWVPLVAQEICAEHYSRIDPNWVVGEGMLCAGDYLPTVANRLDACDGDSGGPLLQFDPRASGHWRQIGIASWGLGCGVNPGVYTEVGSYLDWAPLQPLSRSASCSQTQASPLQKAMSLSPMNTHTNGEYSYD